MLRPARRGTELASLPPGFNQNAVPAILTRRGDTAVSVEDCPKHRRRRRVEMVSGRRLIVEDRRLAYRPPKWITVLRRQPSQHFSNGLHEGNSLVSLGPPRHRYRDTAGSSRPPASSRCRRTARPRRSLSARLSEPRWGPIRKEPCPSSDSGRESASPTG